MLTPSFTKDIIYPENGHTGKVQSGRGKRLIAFDPEFNENGGNVRFRLTYEGPLLGSSTATPRAPHKHEIRKAFHPQLKRLWEVEPNLKAWKEPFKEEIKTDRFRWEYLADIYQRNGYRFVPLATERDSLIVGVEILFLRPDLPGGVIKSGNLDNRLKTLFDALKMPSNADELGGYATPMDGEDPFFVLLENDALLSHVSVETDTLLQPTFSANGKFLVNDARL